MPVGDCESAFLRSAQRDGIALVRAKVSWINQRGHLGLPARASDAQTVLANIFEALGGLPDEQAGKRLIPLHGDFLHESSGTFIEVDESQHFTTARLTTLTLYPQTVQLGYDLERYRELCEQWRERSDKYRASKEAPGFGTAGRTRQRAYHDALRDLTVPAMGHPPFVRVAAPDRDGEAAYRRVCDQLSSLRT